MRDLLFYLYNIISFSFRDVMVGILTVTLLTLLVLGIKAIIIYIIYKLIKGKTKK